MRASLAVLIITVVCVTPTVAQDTSRTPETGTIHFKPGMQKNIPKMYQLKEHKFPYTLTFKKELRLSKYEIHHLTFPSPVKSPHKENNIVHADYYRPKGLKKFPCMVVLHITGGDQALSKMISAQLARNGISAVFLQMAYYGPRRPPGSRLRMLSYDIKHTLNAVQQTVLDIRRAAAWVEAREEVDTTRMGILGTSLGGFMAALSSEMEPKFKKVIILLAGGGLIDSYYDHPKAQPFVAIWETLGGSKEQARKLFAPYDPITCAGNLKNRDVLLIAAKQDEIVPPKMAEAFWNASGRQKIVWYNAGHYTMAFYFLPALHHAVNHIKGIESKHRE